MAGAKDLAGSERPSDDDVPTTTDGRRLDTREKVIAFLEEINAGAPPPVMAEPIQFDLARMLRPSNVTASTTCWSVGSPPGRTVRPGQPPDLRLRAEYSSGDNLDRLAAALRDLGARLRVGGMSDDEARQLPIVIDGATLAAFGSTTWSTDAGPIDVLHDLPSILGRRSYDDASPSSSTERRSDASGTRRG